MSDNTDLDQMDGERWLKVEAKTFVFMKEGRKSFHISERSKKMVKFLLLCETSALWVAKGIEDCLELNCQDGFFRELRLGNGVLSIQHQINTRGSFLQLSDFKNGRRKAMLIVPKGANGIGWNGFVQSIRSIIGFKTPTLEHSNGRKTVDGKTMGRPSLSKGVSYASVLRSPLGVLVEGKVGVGDEGCQVSGGMGASVGCSVGEVEGVLRVVKAQLSGVLEKVRDLMGKVDKGLELVMSLGGGPKIDELSAHAILDSVVNSDLRENGSIGINLDGLHIVSGGNVVAQGTSLPSQVNGNSSSESLPADGDSTSVEDEGFSKSTDLSFLEGSIEVAQIESPGVGELTSNVLVSEITERVVEEFQNLDEQGGGNVSLEVSRVSCEEGCLGSVSGDKIIPLVSLPPVELSSSDWLLHTVNKIKKCVGISHEGYDDQFTALLSAIKAANETKQLKKEQGIKVRN